jgi:hypothetical protein
LNEWLETQEDLTLAPDDPRFGLMMASQIQAWLYFGLVSEFLGKLVVAEDFLTYRIPGKPIITLQKLMTSKEFEIVHDRVKSMTVERQFQWVRKMDEVLDIVRTSCKQQHESGLGFNIPFEEEIFLSIRILGSTIDTFIEDGMNIHRRKPQSVDNSHGWGLGKIIEHRMNFSNRLLPGYCRSDIQRLMNCLPVDAMYYMSLLSVYEPSQMTTKGLKTCHDECTANKCVADNISLDNYETLHSITCDGCELIGPDMAEIEDAIQNNFIPILCLFRKDNGEVALDVIRVAPHKYVDQIDFEHWQPYVAISHVWSQGLGNPKENKLPVCQLMHIYEMVRDCWSPLTIFSDAKNESFMRAAPIREKKWAAFFWIDTLCVPLARTWRRQAIQNMRWVYHNAMAVLVKDNRLAGSGPAEGLSCRLRSCEEIAGWILASPWWRRLWTFQEAVLARNLLIYCNDGVLDVQEFLNFMALRVGAHWGPIPRVVTVPDLAAEIMNRSTERPPESMREELQELSPPTDPRGIETPFEVAATISLQVFNSTGAALVKGLVELRNIRSWLSHQEDHSGEIGQLWNSAHMRMTSYGKDKVLCLATLLDLDVAKLQSIENEEEMVEAFYSILPGFPPAALFSGAEKLTRAGLRWADRNLLTSKVHEQFIIEGAGLPVDPIGRRTEKGLMVDYPGFLISMDIDDLPAESGPFFLYNKRISTWIQVTTDRKFEATARPRVHGVFGMIIQERRLSTPPELVAVLGQDNAQPEAPALHLQEERSAVLVVLSESLDPSQSDPYAVRAERYCRIQATDLDYHDRDPPELEITYADATRLGNPIIFDWGGKTVSWIVG